MKIINPHRFAPPAVDFDGFGNASRYFDGSGDFIDVPSSSSSYNFIHNTKVFSVGAWIKVTPNTSTLQTIAASFATSADVGVFFAFDDRVGSHDNAIRFFVAHGSAGLGDQLNIQNAILDTDWHHVMFTGDGVTIKCYIDGQVQGTTESVTYTGNYGNASFDLSIGKHRNTTPYYFTGNLADFRIYDSDLSSTDIAALYGGENITTNLVGHWLKDTPSLLDHSGTNDGTNEGSAFAYDNPSPAVEFGKASRYFDGNDHIDTNASFNTTFQSAFSFACWVRFTDGTPVTGNIIFGNQENAPISRWLFLLGSDGKIQSNYHSNGNTSFAKINTALPNGDTGWIHLACVITPSGQTLYLNGSQATLDPTQTGDMSGVTMGDYNSIIKCFIGARSLNNSPSLYLDGNLADVRIYDTDLSSTDITALYNGTHLETNLVGHWLTNTDDVKDYAGVNDGTNNGSTYSFDNPLSEGEFGSASRAFDGVNDYIDCGDVLDSVFVGTGKKFTVTAWVKTNTVNGAVICKDNYSQNLRQWNLQIVDSGKVRVVVTNPAGTIQRRFDSVSTYATNNNWTHVAFTYDQTQADDDKVILYANGSAVAHTITNNNGSGVQIYDTTTSLSIGSFIQPSISFPFDGNIADVRIYDTALSAQDIFDLSRGYDYRTNLVGQWLTNKDDVDDYAGTNHGTNNGSTYSQDAPL